jgi:cobalt-zinc-cadmium efflux system membrane fusion protein
MGRLTSVSVTLGAQVELGQPLAQIDSLDLAEAQRRFLSLQASVTALQQRLQQVEKLLAIGAVSRQEFERLRADHTAATSELEATRTQLKLLGTTPEAMASLTSKGEVAATAIVTAPLKGTVGTLDAIVGQSVDVSTRLLTIVDTSSVWIVGDLLEKDFSRVRVGGPAIATMAGSPDVTLIGTVNYIEPELNTTTRSSRIRVEVQNLRGELQPGMRAELQIGEAGFAEAMLVPSDAIQLVGDRQVLYLANVGEPGRFIEREVRLGDQIENQFIVLSGVKPADQIVVRGSVFLRVERERLGLRAAPM